HHLDNHTIHASLCFLLSSPKSDSGHRALHSFPTRRSSDLEEAEGRVPRLARPRDREAQDGGRGALRGGRAPPPRLRHRHAPAGPDRKSTRLNSSHVKISYAVFCLKKKTTINKYTTQHNEPH